MKTDHTANLGDASCAVRFDFTPAQAPNFDVERNPHDGCDAKLTINEVNVNGEWVDAKLFSSDWLKKAEQVLLEEALEVAIDEPAAGFRTHDGYDY